MSSSNIHPQYDPRTWAKLSDEEIIQALFNNPRIVNPRWINWLKKFRPTPLRMYLQMHAAGGGYLGPEAREFIRQSC
jgi:hypothetical protein